jgi:HD-GYP domain-containing protein (c-di-GMP phosphodiesterase class II)
VAVATAFPTTQAGPAGPESVIADTREHRVPEEGVRLSEVVSALSYALDITEGQPQGHAVRTCLIGMRVAGMLHLTADERSALFYALLLKDLGCSSNAARLSALFGADDLTLKRVHKFTDWSDDLASARYALEHVVPDRNLIARAWHTVRMGMQERGAGREMTRTRCERGADIARMLGLGPATSEAIRALDEHWDGGGMPYGLKGTAIPLLGRIACLAQTVEVFAHAFGADAAYQMAIERRKKWFDPDLIHVLGELRDDTAFWSTLDATDALSQVSDLEPGDRLILVSEQQLDVVAEAFARVVDAKSPYTALHSEGVALIADGIGRAMGMTPDQLRTLRRAGLLHDIGKLGVSNSILDKPAKLTDAETAVMREHPRHTGEILARVAGFKAFAGIAAAHHERLDGRGYHLGLVASDLCPLSRVLAVADIAEALSAERPYRSAMEKEEVFRLMRGMVGTSICGAAFEGLVESWE